MLEGALVASAPMARSKSKHNIMKMRRQQKHKGREKRRKAAVKATLAGKPAKAPKAPAKK